MPRSPDGATPPLSLDAGSRRPLYRQLVDGLREAVLSGRLAPGDRLASTRSFAEDLGLSRATVVTAFEQLVAEGYLTSRRGAGTFVSRRIHPRAESDAAIHRVSRKASARPGLSRRGRTIAGLRPIWPPLGDAPRPFRLGVPALDAFPTRIFARLARRAWTDIPVVRLGGGDHLGDRSLREAIAAHLRGSRGVRCDAGQVVVTSGTQEALRLSVELVSDPGDAVWIESPGYIGAHRALAAAGCIPIPVAVDDDGVRVEEGVAAAAEARAAYVTPSHQFPTAATLSLPRRQALLDWARTASVWIIEDDYDSEYGVSTHPPRALQGLEPEAPVLYLGSFSKVLAPALGLGFMVVPESLVDALAGARRALSGPPPEVSQAALATFIAEGHYGRHVRRMRALYEERREALVEALAQRVGGVASVRAVSGMHLVLRLESPDADAAAVARALRGQGVESIPVDAFADRPERPTELLLGYAGHPPEELRKGASALAKVLAAPRRA